MDKEATLKAVKLMYECAGLAPPKDVVFCQSPLDLQETANALQQQGGLPKISQDESKVQPPYTDKHTFGTTMSSDLKSKLEGGNKQWIQPIYGQHDAPWLAFYDYFREVVGLKNETDKLRGLFALAKCAGWAIPYDTVCLVAERHCVVSLNPEGQLHCDGGPAVRYPDGYSIWALNGVRVPQWLAESNANEIAPAEFAKLENAEIRREFIRKVGIEQLVLRLGAESIDTQGDYELLVVDLQGETGKWPYLKMKNPSIGVWHMEAVPKGTKTVQEALEWRNGGEFEFIQEMS
jgi:hypothetical protein